MLPDEQSDAERELAPDTPDASDVPADLKRQFWTLVVVFNTALLATSLGLMLAGFEGNYVEGGALTFMGVAVFFYGVQRYRRVRRD